MANGVTDRIGREWMSSREIARRLGKALLEDERIPQPVKDRLLEHKDVALDVMADAVEASWLHYEFKILRLTEFVAMAIREGQFGPNVVPNTVDVNGERILTPVGEINELFRDIYDPDFLDQFDEEGNPIDPTT